MDHNDISVKKLAIPYYPSNNDDKGHQWKIYSSSERYVAEYCNISIYELENLTVVEFLVYRRDAIIYKLSQTPDGVDYLKNAYRLLETAPDKEALRAKLGTDQE